MYCCDRCSKNFETENALEIHRHLHVRDGSSATKPQTEPLPKDGFEKRFQCRECPLSFTHRYLLKNHSTKHVDEKLHSCAICHNKYKWSGCLKRHVRNIHKGAKPFICSICDNSFNRKGELILHVNSSHNQESFYCHICKTVFKDQNCLKEHICGSPENVKNSDMNLQRSEPANVECNSCKYAFFDKSDFDMHTCKNANTTQSSDI